MVSKKQTRNVPKLTAIFAFPKQPKASLLINSMIGFTLPSFSCHELWPLVAKHLFFCRTLFLPPQSVSRSKLSFCWWCPLLNHRQKLAPGLRKNEGAEKRSSKTCHSITASDAAKHRLRGSLLQLLCVDFRVAEMTFIKEVAWLSFSIVALMTCSKIRLLGHHFYRELSAAFQSHIGEPKIKIFKAVSAMFWNRKLSSEDPVRHDRYHEYSIVTLWTSSGAGN